MAYPFILNEFILVTAFVSDEQPFLCSCNSWCHLVASVISWRFTIFVLLYQIKRVRNNWKII